MDDHGVVSKDEMQQQNMSEYNAHIVVETLFRFIVYHTIRVSRTCYNEIVVVQLRSQTYRENEKEFSLETQVMLNQSMKNTLSSILSVRYDELDESIQ